MRNLFVSMRLLARTQTLFFRARLLPYPLYPIPYTLFFNMPLDISEIQLYMYVYVYFVLDSPPKEAA